MFFLNFFFMISYVTGSNSFPLPLNAEDERKYLLDLRDKTGAEREKAKNILVERNLRLVAHIAKKYSTSPFGGDDLISVGTIGLMKGISSFDCDKGTRLATYVARCIENAMLTLWLLWGLKMENMYLPEKSGAYFAA